MATLFYAFLLIIFLNILGFCWGFFRQSDKLTDLIYSLSFFVVTAITFSYVQDFSFPKILLASMVCLWAVRLGTYLFQRIHKIKKDARFDNMRPNFIRLLGFWILQTVSICIIVSPVILFLGNDVSPSLSTFQIIGFVLWFTGFVVETMADYQKFTFKNNAKNEGKFMQSGLWQYSRHPNYLGEIFCWWGVFLFTSSSLVGWQWLGILSPIWIMVLLLFVSGIPLLEKSADVRYGHLDEYQTYKAKTGILLPRTI